MSAARPKRILLVTGMSGAGKSTALNTLEDLGWEVVDNLPLALLDRLLGTPPPEGAGDDDRPLAFGMDTRTRGFDADAVIRRITRLRAAGIYDISTLFLDCGGAELERRYSETRRRHPLALDRPASDGIAREREILAPLRLWFDHVLDTTALSSNELQHDIRARFAGEQGAATTLLVTSFGFARGLPRNADLVFDMRFLRNPHWDRHLRPLTGLDPEVGEYIAEDPAYAEAVDRIGGLLEMLLPRYRREGKAYVTVAIGCTGGRHRSVHVAEQVAQRLREAGFSPTVAHRDLASRPKDAIEQQH
ncbi:MAG: RNase adaptor protein RapZ [Sphingomonas sp. SCN 67-18]|uniref:RNase adapter RapZ n=1 Tax=uncultured Sphingomonas sp. TaxID=158754 RepID=UPI000869CCF8|nr:RNase adapter RapZ [Sphingomonas sp. SCN 67-18]ODU21405.1 MAG: RNase adaptor protein RapZ [Sphingomonas sp. SCN 67-18]